MKFEYNSSQIPIKKVLSEEITDDVKQYVIKTCTKELFRSEMMTYGEIMTMFLNYRRPNGDRLLINQLEPMYTYFCLNGIWE